MLIQHSIMPPPLSFHLLRCTLPYSSQHVGGCLRQHSFDQRGYHPDPFYGGVMDVFVNPNMLIICFKAQRSPRKARPSFRTGPMVYIAHEMTPSHPKTLLLYSIVTRCGLLIIKVARHGLTPSRQQKKNALTRYYIQRYIRLHMIDKNMSMRKKKQDEVFHWPKAS